MRTAAAQTADPPARLFLASRSPRRRDILRDLGVEAEAGDPGLEDADLRPGAVSPAQWVAALAYLKAAAGLDRLTREGRAEGTVVLGADTACVQGGELIGTPSDGPDAARILRRLEGGEHEVLTGVALVDPRTGRRDLFVDRARVRVGPLGEGRIGEYVRSGRWRGKAGAYNLRERLDAGWPIEYEGDPGTIMGLPVRALIPRLARLGLVPRPAGEAA